MSAAACFGLRTPLLCDIARWSHLSEDALLRKYDVSADVKDKAASVFEAFKREHQETIASENIDMKVEGAVSLVQHKFYLQDFKKIKEQLSKVLPPAITTQLTVEGDDVQAIYGSFSAALESQSKRGSLDQVTQLTFEGLSHFPGELLKHFKNLSVVEFKNSTLRNFLVFGGCENIVKIKLNNCFFGDLSLVCPPNEPSSLSQLSSIEIVGGKADTVPGFFHTDIEASMVKITVRDCDVREIGGYGDKLQVLSLEAEQGPRIYKVQKPKYGVLGIRINDKAFTDPKFGSEDYLGVEVPAAKFSKAQLPQALENLTSTHNFWTVSLVSVIAIGIFMYYMRPKAPPVTKV